KAASKRRSDSWAIAWSKRLTRAVARGPHSSQGDPMPVPILKQGDILIASIQAALSDQDLAELRDELAHRVGDTRARGVVIDVTSLDVLDSFATRTIRGVVYSARLRGAETVVVGIQPEVAFAMVQLGLTLEGFATALDLEEGLELLRETTKERLDKQGRGTRG